jgi:beta-mannosidase
VLDVPVRARSGAAVTIPADVTTFQNAGEEIIVAAALGDAPGFSPAILDGAEIVGQALEADPLVAKAVKTDSGYRVVVTATSYARDVFLQVDRVDPRATVDQGLMSLLAGQSAVFKITSSADVDPELYLAPQVLCTANALCVR